MQGLNRTGLSLITLEKDQESCGHQPVYFGVININIDEKTIGSVDVWRCGACKKQFCEEKQLGIESIADIVGMPKIGPDERWAVTVCKLQKGKDRWRLVRMKRDRPARHECIGERMMELPVSDYKINDDAHWSFLVDENVNQAVEI